MRGVLVFILFRVVATILVLFPFWAILAFMWFDEVPRSLTITLFWFGSEVAGELANEKHKCGIATI